MSETDLVQQLLDEFGNIDIIKEGPEGLAEVPYIARMWTKGAMLTRRGATWQEAVRHLSELLHDQRTAP